VELVCFNSDNARFTLCLTLLGYDNLGRNRYHGGVDTRSDNGCERSIFTLSQSIPYRIEIAGRLGKNLSDWMDRVDIQIDTDPAGFTTTTLTVALDQAGLIGLLRQLYSRGFPLISVNCFNPDE
jgi:hypothetical protein